MYSSNQRPLSLVLLVLLVLVPTLDRHAATVPSFSRSTNNPRHNYASSVKKTTGVYIKEGKPSTTKASIFNKFSTRLRLVGKRVTEVVGNGDNSAFSTEARRRNDEDKVRKEVSERIDG